MKKILTLALAFSCGAALAQKADNVGIGTSKPDPSAILDLNSNSKGLLLPRMSEAQRNAIKNPAAGLIIFQTDQVVGTYTFDGTAWQPSNARTSVTNTGGAWALQGSSIDATDFLGSTNAQSLRFKVNNQKAGILDITGGNTFFGVYAGEVTNYATGTENVGVGEAALLSNTNGRSNLAMGPSAMRLNTTGNFNTAIGKNALRSNTTSHYNVAIGSNALQNSTGNGVVGDNIAIGGNAMFSNTTGTANVAIGPGALYSNTIGIGNFALGGEAMGAKTSGDNNTAIGNFAGQNNTTGSNNVFIGYQAGRNETSSNMFYVANSSTLNPLLKGSFTGNWVKVNSKTTGYLAVGDFDAGTPMPTPTGYRLIVQDGILTEKLKVALRTDGANWADYVFEPNYVLMSLEDVEKYTKDNKHLPNVPSADEITKEGIDVAKVSKMFMEKIEELTLHIIELNKRIKELENKK